MSAIIIFPSPSQTSCQMMNHAKECFKDKTFPLLQNSVKLFILYKRISFWGSLYEEIWCNKKKAWDGDSPMFGFFKRKRDFLDCFRDHIMHQEVGLAN